MSDLETMEQLFTSAGIEFTEYVIVDDSNITCIVLCFTQGEHKGVGGYNNFGTEIVFTETGKLSSIGAFD